MRRFEKPRLFVASSGNARLLAHALSKRLNDEGFVIAEPWTSDDAFPINRQLLQSLVHLAQHSDFAVVIFTGDEARVCGEGKKTYVPRDNCIFELGLFIGAMGTAERCFLMISKRAQSAVKTELSDIAGQRYELFTPPRSLKNEAACEAIVAEWLPGIQKMVKRLGRFRERPRHPLLTTDELMELESSEGLKGGLLPHGTVIIKESQPPEHELRYARVVWDNMMRRAVSYQYLFTPVRENFPKIALMLRALVAAGTLPPSKYEHYGRWPEDRKKEAIAQRFESQKHLSRIDELSKRLFIRFAPDRDPEERDGPSAEGGESRFPPDEFCIHCAANEKRRRGYVKISSGYAPMAGPMAERSYIQYRSLASWPPNTILQGGILAEKEQEEFQSRLKDIFPPCLEDEIVKACLG